MYNTEVNTMFMDSAQCWPVTAQYHFAGEHQFFLFSNWADGEDLSGVKVGYSQNAESINLAIEVAGRSMSTPYCSIRGITGDLIASANMRFVFVSNQNGMIVRSVPVTLGEEGLEFMAELHRATAEIESGKTPSRILADMIEHPTLPAEKIFSSHSLHLRIAA